MAQAVNHRPLAAESRVRSRVSLCGICCGQSGTVTGFSPISSVSPGSIIPPSFSVPCIVWGMNNMSVSDSSSETKCHPINKKKDLRNI
jgi:hypothetical protein